MGDEVVGNEAVRDVAVDEEVDEEEVEVMVEVVVGFVFVFVFVSYASEPRHLFKKFMVMIAQKGASYKEDLGSIPNHHICVFFCVPLTFKVFSFLFYFTARTKSVIRFYFTTTRRFVSLGLL